MSKKIYVGQVGVRILLETQIPGEPNVDWSSADTVEVKCKRPDDTKVNWVMSLVTPTLLEYITGTVDDLPIPGTYKLQAHVVGPGYNALGATVDFQVHAPFT